jgi:hypothetical protein
MTNLDPIALTINGPHKTWWRIGSAIVLVLGLLIAYGGANGALDLDLKRSDFFFRDDGKALRIINTGTQPITIAKLSINNRKDCKASAFVAPAGEKEVDDLLPWELKIGDQFTMHSSCRVIRVEIGAKQGSQGYEFGG